MATEKRLISLDTACGMLNRFLRNASTNEEKSAIFEVKQALLEMGRVEAVEVVRCKDCRFYRKPFCILNDNKNGWLNHELPEHFCSHGQREKDG